MFFGNCNQQEEKIKKLEARIKELEAKEKSDNSILTEMEEVLSKFGKGLCGFRVNSQS